jgi:hypothetical protein
MASPVAYRPHGRCLEGATYPAAAGPGWWQLPPIQVVICSTIKLMGK